MALGRVVQLAQANGDGTLSDDIYEHLRRRVLTLDLAPGCAFTLSELASELGVSRTPIREALARLGRDGLVESEPRAGYRVRPVTLKDARELFSLRTLLEAEAAVLAARRGGEVAHLRELDELCQADYDPHDPVSIAGFLHVNSAFHLAVAELGGNDRLTRALAEVIDQLERYMHLGLSLSRRADEIVHEHRDLLAAILAGDTTRARRAAAEQAHASQKMVLEALLSADAVLTANLAAVLPTGEGA